MMQPQTGESLDIVKESCPDNFQSLNAVGFSDFTLITLLSCSLDHEIPKHVDQVSKRVAVRNVEILLKQSD